MSKAHGFSLVEVLMSLFILSSTAVGFMRVTQTSLEGVSVVEQRYFASLVADNQLVALFSEDIPVRIGVERGQDLQHNWEFDWVRTISEGPRAGVLLVDLEVRLKDEALILASVRTLKMADEP